MFITVSGKTEHISHQEHKGHKVRGQRVTVSPKILETKKFVMNQTF